jgi:hypothetical protein
LPNTIFLLSLQKNPNKNRAEEKTIIMVVSWLKRAKNTVPLMTGK